MEDLLTHTFSLDLAMPDQFRVIFDKTAKYIDKKVLNGHKFWLEFVSKNCIAILKYFLVSIDGKLPALVRGLSSPFLHLFVGLNSSF